MIEEGLVVSWADQRILHAEDGADNIVLAL